MLDAFLNDLGNLIVELVREEITTPQQRYTKKEPRMMKRNSPYNFYASGKGYRSVSYEVIDEDQLYILMEDYMVDYVFGDGSWPGGGAYAKGKGTGQSQLLEKLQKWIRDKGITPRDKRGRFSTIKGMAFAIRKNLFKAGYAGYNYQTTDYNNKVLEAIESLLQQPQYEDLALNQEIQDLLDRINSLGQQTFNISLGRI